MDLFERRRYEPFVNMLFTLIVSILLTLPIVALYAVRNESGYLQVGIAMFCTLLMAALSSLVTRAKKQEILAITAAYVILDIIFGLTNDDQVLRCAYSVCGPEHCWGEEMNRFTNYSLLWFKSCGRYTSENH